MDKTLFKKYQTLSDKLKALEEEKNSLKEQIVKELKKQKIDKAETEYGLFTIAARTYYTYTDKVKALEEKVKLAKVREEQKGIAESRLTEYLVYTNKSQDD